VTLCDTGPLVAIIDAGDPGHGRCVAALHHLPAGPLLTTWPCLTEAMYLLRRAGGLPAQEELWGYVADGLLVLHTSRQGEWERMRTLMLQYHDTPMDLADASLVAAAEALNLRRVFTLDSHFLVYRYRGRYRFQLIP
jgi:predicted nucleic acid-binding protein